MWRKVPHETIYGYCWCDSDVEIGHSLKMLCGQVLIRDASVLDKTLPRVPAPFMPLLLARALEGGRDRAAELLTTQWPDESLSLQTVLGTACPIVHHKDQTTAATAAVRAFIAAATAASGGNLRFLDATNYQMGRELIEFAIRKLRSASGVEGRRYRLRCDCIVGDVYTFQVLCSLLDENKEVLRVEIGNLEVEGVGETRVSHLLALLSRRHLVGLSLAYNSLRNRGTMQAISALLRFGNLAALDLSANGARRGDTGYYEALSQLVRCLPSLRRLNLKGCQVGGYLNVVLPAGHPPNLGHLDVGACSLRRQDLMSLRRLVRLRCLILSDNDLSGLESVLVVVLLTLRELQVLQLSNCGVRAEEFVPLWEAVCGLGSHLRWLDLSWNKLSEDNVGAIALELESGALPFLVRLFVPFPSNPGPRFFEALRRCQLALPRLKVQTDLV